jgi:hypothetical protein
MDTRELLSLLQTEEGYRHFRIVRSQADEYFLQVQSCLKWLYSGCGVAEGVRYASPEQFLPFVRWCLFDDESGSPFPRSIWGGECYPLVYKAQK